MNERLIWLIALYVVALWGDVPSSTASTASTASMAGSIAPSWIDSEIHLEAEESYWTAIHSARVKSYRRPARPKKLKEPRSENPRNPKRSQKRNQETIRLTTPEPENSQREPWYYEWRILAKGHLPQTEETTLQHLDELRLDFRVESPETQWGILQLRGSVPWHRLWQMPAANAEEPANYLKTGLKNTSLYVKWELPSLAANTASPSRHYLPKRYLQLGSITLRSESFWQTFMVHPDFFAARNSLDFPLGDLGRQYYGWQPLAVEQLSSYDASKGLAQRWGLSWDGQYSHALVLYQSSTTTESLHLGAAINLLQHQKINSSKNTTDYYWVQIATMISRQNQNVSVTRSQDGSWYFDSVARPPSGVPLDSSGQKRWESLLDVGRSVKHASLQLGWVRKAEALEDHTAKAWDLRLATEQALSTSPQDYWAWLQKYRIFFHRGAFTQEFFGLVQGASWTNARRNITVASYETRGQSAALESRTTFHWKGQRRSQQVLRTHLEIKQPQFLQVVTPPYRMAQLRYLFLFPEAKTTTSATVAKAKQWSLAWELELVEQEWGKLSELGQTPQQRYKALLELGWRELAPTQKPKFWETDKFPGQQAKAPNQGFPQSKPKDQGKDQGHFSTKLQIVVRQGNIAPGLPALFASFQRPQNALDWLHFTADARLLLLWRLWRYSLMQSGKHTELRWWLPLSFQVQLGVQLSFYKEAGSALPQYTLYMKLQGQFRLAQNWQFIVNITVDQWQFLPEHRASTSPSTVLEKLYKQTGIGFSLRYQHNRNKNKSEAQRISRQRAQKKDIFTKYDEEFAGETAESSTEIDQEQIW